MCGKLEILKPAVQALAQPGPIQISLFPDGVAKGDELMIDFESALIAAHPHLEESATPLQRQAIQLLDDYTDRISGMQNEELWFDESTLMTDLRWQRVRLLAKQVLSAFGWPDEPPPMDDRVYIVGK